MNTEFRKNQDGCQQTHRYLSGRLLFNVIKIFWFNGAQDVVIFDNVVNIAAAMDVRVNSGFTCWGTHKVAALQLYPKCRLRQRCCFIWDGFRDTVMVILFLRHHRIWYSEWNRDRLVAESMIMISHWTNFYSRSMAATNFCTIRGSLIILYFMFQYLMLPHMNKSCSLLVAGVSRTAMFDDNCEIWITKSKSVLKQKLQVSHSTRSSQHADGNTVGNKLIIRWQCARL